VGLYRGRLRPDGGVGAPSVWSGGVFPDARELLRDVELGLLVAGGFAEPILWPRLVFSGGLFAKAGAPPVVRAHGEVGHLGLIQWVSRLTQPEVDKLALIFWVAVLRIVDGPWNAPGCCN